MFKLTIAITIYIDRTLTPPNPKLVRFFVLLTHYLTLNLFMYFFYICFDKLKESFALRALTKNIPPFPCPHPNCVCRLGGRSFDRLARIGSWFPDARLTDWRCHCDKEPSPGVPAACTARLPNSHPKEAIPVQAEDSGWTVWQLVEMEQPRQQSALHRIRTALVARVSYRLQQVSFAARYLRQRVNPDPVACSRPPECSEAQIPAPPGSSRRHCLRRLDRQ